MPRPGTRLRNVMAVLHVIAISPQTGTLSTERYCLITRKGEHLPDSDEDRFPLQRMTSATIQRGAVDLPDRLANKLTAGRGRPGPDSGASMTTSGRDARAAGCPWEEQLVLRDAKARAAGLVLLPIGKTSSLPRDRTLAFRKRCSYWD